MTAEELKALIARVKELDKDAWLIYTYRAAAPILADAYLELEAKAQKLRDAAARLYEQCHRENVETDRSTSAAETLVFTALKEFDAAAESTQSS